MPKIPFDAIPNVASTGAPGVFQGVNTNPGMFGGYTADALQKVGAAGNQFGDVAAENAIRFQKEYNETATDQANTNHASEVRNIVSNFRQLRGQDALNAQASTLQQIEAARQATRASLQNPEQQRMFDYMSRQNDRRYLDEVAFHAASEGKVWQGDVANGAITNALNDISNYWNDDKRFALGIGEIKYQASKLLQLKGIDPGSDTGKAAIQSYVGQAWTARIHSVMAHDSDRARALFDANADQIDAAHRATLDAQITNRQWTDMMRQDAAARRDEIMAERQMRTTQAANLASLTADVLQGKPVNWGNVADGIRSQQLSPGTAEFLIGLQRRRASGPDSDRPDAVIALHKVMNDPNASVDDKINAIQGAAHHGAITANTTGALVDQAYKSDTRVETATQREAKAAVLAAAGTPDGMINLSHDDAVRKAQVLTEWQNRMMAGEDPIAVRDDMIPKYTPSGVPPATLARPRYGAVNSKLDVKAAAAWTKQQLASGAITPAQAASEGTLLNQYDAFFQRVDAARAAAASVRPKAQPTNGPKAKVRGVTRTENE